MKAASGCMRCLRRSLASRSSTHDTAGSIRAARSIFSTSTLRSDLPPSASTTELEQQRQAAKQRAWYLDPSDAAPPPSLAPSSKPRFTTFDPSSTLPTAAPALPARPLPDNAPPHFAPLHHFLTNLELLEPSSVVFLHTPSSGSLQRDEEELGVGGIGARWEWVVVAVVRGRGRGVVGRAERAVRLWLKDNPSPKLSTKAAPRRMPRVEADTDWSLVPIGQSRACINLFTQEGRDRWDLEDLFAAK